MALNDIFMDTYIKNLEEENALLRNTIISMSSKGEKMKKREKEFWVIDGFIELIKKSDGHLDSRDFNGQSLLWKGKDIHGHRRKITISWEEPEKKITISESEWDQKVENWREFLRYNDTHKALVDNIRKSLFGGGE